MIDGMLPFTREQFFAIFGEYNVAVWPMQVALTALALAALILVFARRSWSGRAIAAILAFFWAWIAIAYHGAHFTRINPLAYAFAALSFAGALAFLWHGVIRNSMRFGWNGRWRAAAGTVMIGYALMAYPAWSWLAGHRYPEMPTFGLPCPTTIFTLGILAFLLAPVPRIVFVVPILWSAIGVQAVFFLGVPQDLGLGVAGLAGLLLAWRRPVRR
jgi:hypothetical protein